MYEEFEVDEEWEYEDDDIQNRDQAISIDANTISDYTKEIQMQLRTCNPDPVKVDWIFDFIANTLGIKDPVVAKMEDKSIYIDPDLLDPDRMALSKFSENLGEIFSTTFGISFSDPDIFLYYSIYQIFCINFVNYFAYYINGLQKLTKEFEEDIPNWNELSFDYYINNVREKKENDSTYIRIEDYLDYILEIGLIPEEYIEIALLEASGDSYLSALYIEDANFRLIMDFAFLKEKITRIVHSDSLRDFIMDKLVETIGESVVHPTPDTE